MGNITQLSQGNLDGLKKQVCECLTNAYDAGHKAGKLEGLCANTLTNEEKDGVYAKGYEQGKRDLARESRFNEKHIRELLDNAKQEGYDNGYDEGLKDLTHAMKVYFPLNAKERLDYFGINTHTDAYAIGNPKNLIAKAKAYKEKKQAEEEINVGDEVQLGSDRRGIVVSINGDWYRIIMDNGFVNSLKKKDFEKIGRNFSAEVSQLLDKLKGDNNESNN